jgi:hypothetical protein
MMCTTKRNERTHLFEGRIEMGVNQTPDGRVNVGLGYNDINEYKGYAGRREIVIQLTSDGATQDSLDALEFLKSYAIYHNSVGEPIFPASTNVFISNNGVTKAVEADEVTVDGNNVNIGGCVWNGESWDFTNAGQGGGSDKFIVTLTPTSPDFSGTMDKTAEEITAAYEAGQEIIFNVVGFPGFDHVYIPAAWCSYATDHTNCAACATLVDVTSGLQIIISTDDAQEGSNYFTDIYSLTPAS